MIWIFVPLPAIKKSARCFLTKALNVCAAIVRHRIDRQLHFWMAVFAQWKTEKALLVDFGPVVSLASTAILVAMLLHCYRCPFAPLLEEEGNAGSNALISHR